MGVFEGEEISGACSIYTWIFVLKSMPPPGRAGGCKVLPCGKDGRNTETSAGEPTRRCRRRAASGDGAAGSDAGRASIATALVAVHAGGAGRGARAVLQTAHLVRPT